MQDLARVVATQLLYTQNLRRTVEKVQTHCDGLMVQLEQNLAQKRLIEALARVTDLITSMNTETDLPHLKKQVEDYESQVDAMEIKAEVPSL